MYEFKAYVTAPSLELVKFKGQNKYDEYGNMTFRMIAIEKAVSPL